MALTKSEREEINRAIKDSLQAVLVFLQENRGSPAERAQRGAVDWAGMQALAALQGFTDRPVDRRRDLSGQDVLLGGILDETLMLATQPKQRKKRASQFNKAVSEGMKIVRKSKSYGKAGTINNSKKAFTAVTKTVSKARQGKKSPKSGVLRRVFSNARKRMLSEISRKKIPGVARGRQFDFLKKGRK
tara:strand:- start:802 stop:1365 length:564 start_codon:yes stop_codon:yes gene_type:complete